MKTKKQYIKIGLILFLIILISTFFFKEKERIPVASLESNYNEEKFKSQEELPFKVSSPKIETESLPVKKIKVSLTILDKKYYVEIINNSSVIDAMKQIEKESSNLFSFKYIDNASLGSFITEINGEKGTPGKYWIYYINGELASVGVSNQILNEGDIINWSQEGI